jgi:hypothetical protein
MERQATNMVRSITLPHARQCRDVHARPADQAGSTKNAWPIEGVQEAGTNFGTWLVLIGMLVACVALRVLMFVPLS